MTNTEAASTTQTAAVKEQGADVAPEKASSTQDVSQKKNAPRGRISSYARDSMIADGALKPAKAKKSARKAKPPKAAEPKAGAKIAKVKATAKAARPPKAKQPAKAAKPAAEAREGSKKDMVMALLRRKDGATMSEISEATGWQNHTIRGFMSGNVGKRMGLAVQSSKNAAGERMYKLAK